MRMKLTKTTVARIRAPNPSGRQEAIWDETLKGFGILVSGRTNVCCYIVQKNVAGRSVRITVGPTNVLGLEEARERAIGLLADLYAGKNPKEKTRRAKHAGLTLRGALDAYLEGRKSLRPATGVEYRRSAELYLAEWLDLPLASITPDMVEARHKAIQKEVEGRNTKPDGSKRNPLVTGRNAANGALKTLRTLWSFSADSIPDLPTNPVRRMTRRWFREQRRDRLVKDSELPAFFEAVQELENTIQRDYIQLLLFTGLRRREAASLEWTDIDFAAQVIRVPAARTKANRALDLPMSDFVRDLLVARRAIGTENQYVFAADSASGHLEEPRAGLAIVRQATGIHVSPHDLRRTFATAAESVDISLYTLKALLNHSRGGGDVTAGYIQQTTERLREPMQRVADRLKVLCKIEPPSSANVAALRSLPR